MGCGRPVVALPYAGHVGTFAENVLIAWDGSREAARAVADALPLLRRARFVTVTVVHRMHGTVAPEGIDVAAFLQRHGIHASFSTVPRVAGISTGETLLNRLSDLHADLLVMGAYGHPRVQERVLGGVTRTMLETMTVPVLMSH
jgi:nucleotide-binding universal stress UspA family protein